MVVACIGLLVVACARVVHAFGTCTNADDMASFDAGLTAQAQECDVIDESLRIRWSGNERKVRLVKLHDVPRDATRDHLISMRTIGACGRLR